MTTKTIQVKRGTTARISQQLDNEIITNDSIIVNPLARIELQELNLNMIRPNDDSVKTTAGGTKLTIIGKPGSGKSVLIKALLYAKRHLIPVGTVISGSEDTNQFYSKLFPQLFVYEKFKLSIIESVQKRQKLAKEQLSNSWAVLICDDCCEDVKVFSDPLMVGLMKNSRHWNLMTIFANQYVFDFKPVIRQCIDGVFIFREPNMSSRKKIYDNFASIIPSFPLFCQILDDITTDYTCLYIHNQTSSNNWRECVYYYKAPLIDDFAFGCDEYRQFAQERTR
jgi:energy-coupling factor transporter ATP-binding protein EcfA2